MVCLSSQTTGGGAGLSAACSDVPCPPLPHPRPQELEDIYQNAASDVLVALCRHTWPEVAQHLKTELLTGVFPHRSFLYVMGTLSSHGMCCPQEGRVGQGLQARL